MLETDRLLFERFETSDLDLLTRQRTTPNVARFIGGLELQKPAFVEKRLNDYFADYSILGFGMCKMIWKETGENIGWGGLQPLEQSGEIEIGYGMVEEFWGRGIATECSMAWLEYGFDRVGLERIVAIASEENIASRRVLEKCGMKFDGIRRFHGMDLTYYSLMRDDFGRSI